MLKTQKKKKINVWTKPKTWILFIYEIVFDSNHGYEVLNGSGLVKPLVIFIILTYNRDFDRACKPSFGVYTLQNVGVYWVFVFILPSSIDTQTHEMVTYLLNNNRFTSMMMMVVVVFTILIYMWNDLNQKEMVTHRYKHLNDTLFKLIESMNVLHHFIFIFLFLLLLLLLLPL